jgi:hypothetical protein
MNLWIVVGFGLYKGFWLGTLRLFLGTALASLSTSFPKPTIGTYGFEAGGILMFIGSLFVAFYGFELVRAALARSAGADSAAAVRRDGRLVAVGAMLGAAAKMAQPDVYYIEALEPELDMLGAQLVDANVRNIASVVAPSLSEKPQLFEGAWYTDSDLSDWPSNAAWKPGTPARSSPRT